MKYIETVSLTPSEASEKLVVKRFDYVTGEGYQRNVCKKNVQLLAKVAEEAGSWVFPVINGVRHGDKIEVIDGQNRSLAAQLAQIETIIAIWDIAESDRPKVFVDWNKGQPITNAHLLNVSGAANKVKQLFTNHGLSLEVTNKNSISINSIGASQVMWMLYELRGEAKSFNERLTKFMGSDISEFADEVSTIKKVFELYSKFRNVSKCEPNMIRATIKLIGEIGFNENSIENLYKNARLVHSTPVSRELLEELKVYMQ